LNVKALYLESVKKDVITLYIRKGTTKGKVLSLLKREEPIISNIKSRVTREGIKSALQRMKTFIGKMPLSENGYIIVADSDRLAFINHIPIDIDKYYCGGSFYNAPLEEFLLTRLNPIGIIIIDTKEATIGYIASGIEVIKTMTSGISGKHHKGGFSQARFQRNREEEINAFFKRIAVTAKAFLTSHKIELLLISGPGLTKNKFCKGKYLDPRIQEKVLDTFNTQYTREYGLKETLKKALPRIKKNAFADEIRTVENFFDILGKHFSMVVYGEDEVSHNISRLAKLIKIEEHPRVYPMDTTILHFQGEHYEKIKNLGGVVGIKLQ